MSVGIYVRVSTVGQNEAGQRAEIERWLRGNGIKAAEWYVDKESGDTLQRADFERLQRDVFNGQITTIIVWKLDRLSRSMRDGINVLCDWLDKGLRFVSVTQEFDFKGAIGKMIAALLFGVAEMEQETGGNVRPRGSQSPSRTASITVARWALPRRNLIEPSSCEPRGCWSPRSPSR